MAELRDTFRSALAERPSLKMRALLVEVALIGGVNDQLHHAQELGRFLAAFARDEVLTLTPTPTPTPTLARARTRTLPAQTAGVARGSAVQRH